ncbi:Sua5/YciO/YrdC/YwlC family protein [Algihabitans albus]|uniref:Sua5/YciO/YrdC/YwlC family protein n=1 Tax=Algihabitans albus TaxID=2164067 RepID=UPI000E5C5DA3|nr:Sua5/YciO/YrdC/YwlC family protein [Algihabitans albus]
MSQTIAPQPPIQTTGDPIPRERLERDVAQVLEVLYGGGVAIVPLDVAYAIVGHREDAIRRIFAAKNRSYEKPSGMFSNWRMSEEIHILPDEKREMIRTVIEQDRLPFSVVAPFRDDHACFREVDPFVIQNSTKAKTLDMLLNAGAFHDEIARQSSAAGKPVFGSSANTSLKGSKYRLQEIEPEVLAAADICVDYGQSKYANDQGRSSTIIDFNDFSVIRVGVVFDKVRQAFKDRFDVDLKLQS